MSFGLIIRSALAALSVLATPAWAQPCLEKNLQYWQAFPPGGESDLSARHQQAVLRKKCAAIETIVQYKAGAGGALMWSQMNSLPGDGFNVVGINLPHIVFQPIEGQVQYKTADITPVFWFHYTPDTLVVPTSSGIKNFAEFIEAAKKDPGKLSYSSAGTGSIVQMGAELFRTKTGIELMHVPYKGGAPATLAVLRGEVTLNVNDLSTFQAQIAEGKLKPLAVAHTSRLKPLPNVPTFTELGMPEIVSSSWWGIAVPVKTPAVIQTKLREWNQKIVTNPDYIARLAEMAFEPINMTPEQTAAFIAAEIAKWQTVAKAANIQLD
jgi:tripartite-type tricarboxylate transporter receptor subunit TctC